MSTELLRIENLHAWYGESHILHGVDLSVNEGEVVTLLGRNGAGRTTTMRAIMGLTGTARARSASMAKKPSSCRRTSMARLGVGYCPEERGIFASLTAEENLMLPPTLGPGGMSMEEIYAMFPNLAERASSPGTRLSGGEQQMLAVARILRTGARLLLLDEISEGLAPVIVQKLAEMIRRSKRGLHHGAGGAELPLCCTAGGPLLRDGARPHRQAVCAASCPEHGHAAGIPGRLTPCPVPIPFLSLFQPNRRQVHETQNPRRCPGRRPWRFRIRAETPARSRSVSSPTCPACMPTSTARPAVK
jgi:branched-chain amino acid transport system ATP-binding protein